MNRGKNGFSVLFGFIAYGISQTLALLVLFIAALFNTDIMKLFTENNHTPSFDTLKLLLVLAAVSYGLAIAITAFFNIKFLNKGVNVD